MSIAPAQSTRSETIASTLRDEILAGQYRAGERLPSERDLCERFGVSRGAVREALKQLQQLGIASIRPGGARVIPVENCTLDVLGPLLDLNEVPDAKLADEVLHMLGVLMREAAMAAVAKASDEQLRSVDAIVDEIMARSGDPARQFDAVRELAEFFVSVADHLVLRLMINGLRTTFLARMEHSQPIRHVNADALAIPVERIQKALVERNSKELGAAMVELNRLFRDGTRKYLEARVTKTN